MRYKIINNVKVIRNNRCVKEFTLCSIKRRLCHWPEGMKDIL